MIAVPVNVSWRNTSRSENGTRPSRMRADFAPASSASKHASTFGIIPPSITPEAISSRASCSVSSGMSDFGFAAIAENAGRVGEEDGLVGLERTGDGGGGGVGVDVQPLAVGVEGE